MPTAGAPSFAQFEKGGNHERLRSEVSAEGTRGCVGSIATRPFDKIRAGSCKNARTRTLSRNGARRSTVKRRPPATRPSKLHSRARQLHLSGKRLSVQCH